MTTCYRCEMPLVLTLVALDGRRWPVLRETATGERHVCESRASVVAQRRRYRPEVVPPNVEAALALERAATTLQAAIVGLREIVQRRQQTRAPSAGDVQTTSTTPVPPATTPIENPVRGAIRL